MKIYLKKNGQVFDVQDTEFTSNAVGNFVRYYFVDDNGAVVDNPEISFVNISFKREDSFVIANRMAAKNQAEKYWEYVITETDGVLYRRGALLVSAQFTAATYDTENPYHEPIEADETTAGVYYTRSGTAPNYVFTAVTLPAGFVDGTTYYARYYNITARTIVATATQPAHVVYNIGIADVDELDAAFRAERLARENLAGLITENGVKIERNTNDILDLQDLTATHTAAIEQNAGNIDTIEGKLPAYDAHVASKANPHEVTKAQVGLSNVLNEEQMPASYRDTDPAMTNNSDQLIPSQKAVKSFVKTMTDGSVVSVSYTASSGVLTFTHKSGATTTIDLPLELIVTDGYYDADLNNIVLMLANGGTIDIPIDALATTYFADEATVNLYTDYGDYNKQKFRVDVDGLVQYLRIGEVAISTETGLGTGDIVWKVAYGNGVWVAVTNTGKLIATTNPLSSWTLRENVLGEDVAINSVAYGDGVWVIVGHNGKLATATDPISGEFTLRANPLSASDFIRNVAFGDGKWVAVGYGALITAEDPTSVWTERATNIYNKVLNDISYGDGKWVAVGYDATSFNGIVLTSIGTPFNWVKTNLLYTIPSLYFVAYGGGHWVAGGAHSALLITTDPTGLWTEKIGVIPQGAGDYRDAVYEGGLWVLISSSSKVAITSDPAGSWLPKQIDFGGSMTYSIAYGNDKFVLTGQNGKIGVISNTYLSPNVPVATLPTEAVNKGQLESVVASAIAGVSTKLRKKVLTQGSVNISVEGAAPTITVSVEDADVNATSVEVQLFPADTATEEFLQNNLNSSIVEQVAGGFSFSISNPLPAEFSFYYLLINVEA